MSTMFWIWMAAAVLFLIGEIAVPTFFFLCFAVAAAATGVYSIWGPQEYYWQIGIFIIVSLVLIPLTRNFAKRVTSPHAQKANIDNIVGSTALVVKEISAHESGQVKIEGEVWSATATEAIPLNSSVRVVKISGTKVHVERVN